MRWLGKKRFEFFGGQGGFTLLEIIIAVGILGFIGGGVVLALDTNSRATRVLDEQVEAVNLATAYFEAIRQLDYDKNSPNEYSTAGDNIDIPPQYSVDIDVKYSNDGTTWNDYDPLANPAQTIQRITVIVSREGGRPVLSICTFRTEFY